MPEDLLHNDDWTLGQSLVPWSATGFTLAVSAASLAHSPSAPVLRIGLIAASISLCLISLRDLTPDDTFNETFATWLLVGLAHMSYLLCIVPAADLDAERRRYASPWTFARKMVVNPRCIGTRWSVLRSDSPPVGRINRSRFVARKMTTMLFCYAGLCIAYDALTWAWMPTSWSLLPDDYSPQGRAHFWVELSRSVVSVGRADIDTAAIARGLVLRGHCVGSFIVLHALTLTAYHAVLAIFFVGVLHIDEPSEWPSLFGDIRQAFTVRSLWGSFWHLLIYRSFTGHTKALLRSVAGDPSSESKIRRTMTRYLANGLVLIASGVMHQIVAIAVDPQADSQGASSGARDLFGLQIVAIVFEEAFQAAFWSLWRQSRFYSVKSCRKAVDGIARLTGHIWVIVWVMLSHELAYFSTIYQQTTRTSLS